MADIALLPSRHRIDTDAYFAMAEAGMFRPGERVELIEGEITDMAPIGQDHEASVIGLTRALVLACGDRALVSTQNSVRLGRWSAPQPDFAVLRYRDDYYRHGERAGVADVLLLIEVSDTSLRHDRTVKLPLYARFGIPEVWIVDLPGRRMTSHRDPGPNGYAIEAEHGVGQTVALSQDAAIAISLDRLF